MDPQNLINIIKALDELVETAIKKTVYDKDFDGLSLLDYINNKSYDYDYLVDIFPRDDGLLVYGPYDLEKITGAGRSDLNLVIEPIISETDDTIEKFRVSLQDQNTVASSGLAMRQDIDNIFVLELGEFSTIEEMENLFTQTSDIDGTNAKVSLVGNKLDEIFPNSEADIELVLTNEKPLISETVRQRVDRNFMPEYIAQAMEDLDNETSTQYSELAGDVEIPDTPEGAAADIVPDDISSIDTPTNVVDDVSPVLQGREGLPITAEEDRMLEIRWATEWNANKEWGVQVHGTNTSEVIDGFYQFKADNPDIPNWWFPRDLIDKNQLEQRAYVGWGVRQEDIDD